jgi:hypothetical protein
VSSAHPLHFLFFCLLCSLHHSPSMYHSSTMHFYFCTLPPCTHLNSPPGDNPFSPPFVFHSSSLCCLCACNIRNASAFSLHAKFLHNLSAMFDHHHDSSASLVVLHSFNIIVCYIKIPQPPWHFETLCLLCDN